MLKVKKSDNIVFRKFIQKRLLYYILPNIFFNTLIPYLTLRDLGPVFLFQGEYCVARFLLPMALFLPFIITYDILKKTIVLSEEGKAGFLLPGDLAKNKFMFRMAGINGALSFSVNVLVMVLIHLNVPKGYGFNGTLISLAIGLVAAALTVLSTLWPIKRVKALIVE
ncbi:hypothetical protein OQX61_21125 [Pedobacter sp. PLR]|uniref:hypothetical protein n=1 Tax=Pedobacter sp. PLR TaxID=2994465 RepID=UPI0022464CCE|nr:hypothetical protein [Pedobacter sp. PLR]MCX2453785.1 hypothetical protein [Pedobacter sp. PLR]